MYMRVLVIEDEVKLARLIGKALEKEHYAVDVVHDGEEGLAMAHTEPYDVLVIDRMLPGMSGTEIIVTLRRENVTTPALLLTALGTTKDKTYGLDIGADDYLVKPFALEELLARIRALLRRPPTVAQSILKIGDLELDTHAKSISRQGKLIELTAKEYALLEYLMRHPGQTITKETLIAHVWDFDADILPNNVEAHIKQLRRKIDKPFGSSLIQTVRGFGYRMGA